MHHHQQRCAGHIRVVRFLYISIVRLIILCYLVDQRSATTDCDKEVDASAPPCCETIAGLPII